MDPHRIEGNSPGYTEASTPYLFLLSFFASFFFAGEKERMPATGPPPSAMSDRLQGEWERGGKGGRGEGGGEMVRVEQVKVGRGGESFLDDMWHISTSVVVWPDASRLRIGEL